MFQSPIHRIVVSSLGLNRFRRFFSALFLLCLVLQSGFAHAESPTDSPSPERQRALVHLVRQGGLGPALTPEALRDKPVDSLVAVVYSGRPGTPMPPWKRFMTEAEAAWIVEQLMEGFPN